MLCFDICTPSLFSPLPSGVQISKQNRQGTIDPINNSTPAHCLTKFVVSREEKKKESLENSSSEQERKLDNLSSLEEKLILLLRAEGKDQEP